MAILTIPSDDQVRHMDAPISEGDRRSVLIHRGNVGARPNIDPNLLSLEQENLVEIASMNQEIWEAVCLLHLRQQRG